MASWWACGLLVGMWPAGGHVASWWACGQLVGMWPAGGHVGLVGV